MRAVSGASRVTVTGRPRADSRSHGHPGRWTERASRQRPPLLETEKGVSIPGTYVRPRKRSVRNRPLRPPRRRDAPVLVALRRSDGRVGREQTVTTGRGLAMDGWRSPDHRSRAVVACQSSARDHDPRVRPRGRIAAFDGTAASFGERGATGPEVAPVLADESRSETSAPAERAGGSAPASLRARNGAGTEQFGSAER